MTALNLFRNQVKLDAHKIGMDTVLMVAHVMWQKMRLIVFMRYASKFILVFLHFLLKKVELLLLLLVVMVIVVILFAVVDNA